MTTQKTVLITGTSAGGIGDALAQEFHSRGHRVFATARNLSKVAHLKEMGIETLILEVTSEESIAAAVEEVSKLTGGKLDILVNNSGAGYQSPLIDGDLNAVKKMFDVNVFGLIAVTNAFSPLLIASQGTVINIGSIAGVTPVPWQGYYNATKAAVNLLTDNLRLELSPFGVKVILVITGVIKTKFFENQEGTKLKDGSAYSPAKAGVEETMRSEAVAAAGMDVNDYAKAVVSNALKSNPTKRMWIGGNSFTIWFVSTFGWGTIWDWVIPSRFGLTAAAQKIRAAKKTV